MSKRNARVLWLWLGPITLSLTLGFWFQTQGAVLDIPTFVASDLERSSAALVGAIVCSVFVIVMASLTRQYAMQSPGEPWVHKIPQFPKLDLADGGAGTKRIQGAIVFAFLGVPALGLIHFVNKMHSATAYAKDGSELSGWDHWFVFHPFRVVFSNDYRFGSPDDGVTYFPFWEPWCVVTLVAFAWFMVVRALLAISRD